MAGPVNVEIFDGTIHNDENSITLLYSVDDLIDDVVIVELAIKSFVVINRPFKVSKLSVFVFIVEAISVELTVKKLVLIVYASSVLTSSLDACSVLTSSVLILAKDANINPVLISLIPNRFPKIVEAVNVELTVKKLVLIV